jgi:hypothetical protein
MFIVYASLLPFVRQQNERPLAWWPHHQQTGTRLEIQMGISLVVGEDTNNGHLAVRSQVLTCVITLSQNGVLLTPNRSYNLRLTIVYILNGEAILNILKIHYSCFDLLSLIHVRQLSNRYSLLTPHSSLSSRSSCLSPPIL